MLAGPGLGWIGLDGSMLIDLGGVVHIERQAVTPGPRATLPGTITWTASAADVAETLLSTLLPGDGEGAARRNVPLVQELAALADRSLGAVSRALRDFEAQGWISAEDAEAGRSRGRRPARRIDDPSALLDAWSSSERRRFDDRRFHILDRDPARITARISEVFGDAVVFGGLVAADRIAPYSTGISVVRCHIDAKVTRHEFDLLAGRAGLTPTDAGARVIVSTARPPVLNAASVRDGLRVAGPIRSYVDLLRDSVRGDEPAEHLRRLAIRF